MFFGGRARLLPIRENRCDTERMLQQSLHGLQQQIGIQALAVVGVVLPELNDAQ